MDLSIIIPSYNTKALLERCLTSVFTSLGGERFFFEVIVVDNASTDGSPREVRKKFPQVQVVRNKRNVGYGKANNQAINIAKGRYILLLNSDIFVHNDAIGALYQFMREKKKAFAGGKLLNEDGSPQSSCGPFYTLPITAMMLFAKGDRWGITRFSPRETRQVDWVSGSCLIGEKAAFARVGLFDEAIFMYMEEVDFLYRARDMGYATYFYPMARFTHAGAASSADRRMPVVNIYRGLLYFYQKHYGAWETTALRGMLYAKAALSVLVGRAIGRQDVVTTYEKAISLL